MCSRVFNAAVALLAAVLSLGAAQGDHAAATAAPGEGQAYTVQKLIADGVALHDAGKFDQAIEQYKRALEADAGNPMALYELAVTYFATKQYDLCETTARQGFERAGSMQGPLFTVAGSCLSAAGKAEEAVGVFAEGLAKRPNDPGLNFNIAIALFHDGKAGEAVPYLEKAIEANPAFSSPYLALSEALAAEKRSAEAIWLVLRFLSLEVDSQRTAAAATRLFELLGAEVSDEEKQQIQLGVSPENQKDPIALLETGRALVAGALRNEGDPSKSLAARHVLALDRFVLIASELSRGAAGAKLTETFLWKRAAVPIIELQRKGMLEPFGHVLAARAGLAGAEEWLAGNPQKVKQLEAALGS